MSLTRSTKGITKDVGQSRDSHTEWGNRGRGTWETQTSFVQINDNMVVLAANETNSWERDHRCDTGDGIVDGKY